MATHTILWEFEVRSGSEAEFERAYGPDGDWARLFAGAEGYLGTELLRGTGRHYITIDRWRTEADHLKFRKEHVSEYDALDARCAKWTVEERERGSWQAVGNRPGGIGGVFFKAKDAKRLADWYVEQLGFPRAPYGVTFRWPNSEGSTTWGPFPEDTTYFDPTAARFMINYRVADLDAVLARLREAGARVDEKIQAEEYGRFGWAIDPEGNRFELWEPAPGY